MKSKFLPFGIVLLVLAVAALGVQVWMVLTWMGSPAPVGRAGFPFHPGFFFPLGPLLLAAGFFFWARRSKPREALELLAIEYAQGRIDREEYLSRKAVLEDRG